MNDEWTRFTLAMRQGRYFDAHEILEEPWRNSREHRLQVAIWLAAALTHWSRDQLPGTTRLLERILNDADTQDLPIRETLLSWIEAARRGEPVIIPPVKILEDLKAWAISSSPG